MILVLCPLMGGTVFLLYWLTGLRYLEPVGCWVGPVLCVKMTISRRADARVSPGVSTSSVLAPAVNCRRPLPTQETLKDLQVVLIQALMEPLFTLCPIAHETPCSPPSVESLFPLSCGSPALNPCWHSKLNTLGVPPDARTTRVSLTSGSELSLLWENLCDRIIFQSVGCQPTRHGTWLYPECSSYYLFMAWLLVWVHNIYLVGSSRFLLDDCSAVVNFDVLPERRWAKSFYFTILISFV